MKYLDGKKGFTLIELLVVVAIIGLLSSVVLASLDKARAKARDAKRITDMKAMKLALELYYEDKKSYPTCSVYIDNDTNCLATALKPYLNSIPKDPAHGGDGKTEWGKDYQYFGGGDRYNARASFETEFVKQDTRYPNTTTCQSGSLPRCTWYQDCVYRGYGSSCPITYNIGENR